jgi:DNA-repair protein XRCC1
MPIIKLKSISSVSSEDPNHPATNLLSEDTYRKWQCATAGEKQSIIIIETEEASFFHSVDIGNNGCAFVEVLVGRSSGGDNYEVLLTASSFMSPAESKSWTNINRVRMFGRDKLSKLVLDQKWDKIKLVCTQPFNKIEKYGISFVKFHSPPSDEATPTEPDPTQKIGIFNLKPVSPVGGASDTVLFKKQPKSMAAKARLASAEAIKAEEEGVLTTPPAPPSKSTTENPRKKPSNDKSPKDAPPNKKPKGILLMNSLDVEVYFNGPKFNLYLLLLRSRFLEEINEIW